VDCGDFVLDTWDIKTVAFSDGFKLVSINSGLKVNSFSASKLTIEANSNIGNAFMLELLGSVTNDLLIDTVDIKDSKFVEASGKGNFLDIQGSQKTITISNLNLENTETSQQVFTKIGSQTTTSISFTNWVLTN
jgi:hypothetical protein